MRISQRPEHKEPGMVITEESPLGYDIECSCGHTTFALRTSGVVECLRCGRARDPRRLLYKWMRHDDAAAPNLCQAY